MTQDATLKIKEQGAWLTINVGSKDEPRIMKLKLAPADFDELETINSKIREFGAPLKGKAGKVIDHSSFTKEVGEAVSKFVIDWNLVDEDGRIEPTPENVRKQLGRFMIAFAVPEETESEDDANGADQPKPEAADATLIDKRPTVLTLILKFIGDYSNFFEA